MINIKALRDMTMENMQTIKNKDSLGDRMKVFYENRTRYLLPRRTYTIIRLDGKAFHTYTKGLNKPFDSGFVEDMDKTACYLCQNIQGAKFAKSFNTCRPTMETYRFYSSKTILFIPRNK